MVEPHYNTSFEVHNECYVNVNWYVINVNIYSLMEP